MIYKIAHAQLCIIRFSGMILNVKWRMSSVVFMEVTSLLFDGWCQYGELLHKYRKRECLKDV